MTYDNRFYRRTPIYTSEHSPRYREGFKHGILTGAIVSWAIFLLGLLVR